MKIQIDVLEFRVDNSSVNSSVNVSTEVASEVSTTAAINVVLSSSLRSETDAHQDYTKRKKYTLHSAQPPTSVRSRKR